MNLFLPTSLSKPVLPSALSGEGGEDEGKNTLNRFLN
jgi:hypothetical protein